MSEERRDQAKAYANDRTGGDHWWLDDVVDGICDLYEDHQRAMRAFTIELLEKWVEDQEALDAEFGMGDSRWDLPQVAAMWERWSAISGESMPVDPLPGHAHRWDWYHRSAPGGAYVHIHSDGTIEHHAVHPIVESAMCSFPRCSAVSYEEADIAHARAATANR